jgi:putative ABC transport system permease protein
MLRNYLLLAFKVLQRHKFYTFISLFGIAVTLMVLIVLTSLIESFVHPDGPERNSDRFLVAGTMTMLQRNAQGQREMTTTGMLSYRFFENHVKEMQTPEFISVFSGFVPVILPAPEMVGFRDGVKIESTTRRTDANYWRILQFDFLEGRPINDQEHEQGAYVAVISESTRDQYFDGEPAVGQRITLDGMGFEVIGVVEDVSPLQTFASADIWLPLFATPSTQFRTEERGSFMMLLQARSIDDLPRIQEEYELAVRSYQPLLPSYFVPERKTEIYSYALSKLGIYVYNIGNEPGVPPSEVTTGRTLLISLIVGMLLFMLLPVINLVNINISRILDRASEIGVRKSFGASSSHLVRQFIVENLVVTVCGGVLGFVLAVLVLQLIGNSELLSNESFRFNYRVFGLGLLYILVFGLLSAVWPAWKMSRLDPVHALKGQI